MRCERRQHRACPASPSAPALLYLAGQPDRPHKHTRMDTTIPAGTSHECPRNRRSWHRVSPAPFTPRALLLWLVGRLLPLRYSPRHPMYGCWCSIPPIAARPSRRRTAPRAIAHGLTATQQGSTAAAVHGTMPGAYRWSQEQAPRGGVAFAAAVRPGDCVKATTGGAVGQRVDHRHQASGLHPPQQVGTGGGSVPQRFEAVKAGVCQQQHPRRQRCRQPAGIEV